MTLLKSLFLACLDQEQLESSKRGWELKHLQKLKEEDNERQQAEGDVLFTYTREDAYNMVRGRLHMAEPHRRGAARLLNFSLLPPQEYVFDADDDHTEIMPVRLQRSFR